MKLARQLAALALVSCRGCGGDETPPPQEEAAAPSVSIAPVAPTPPPAVTYALKKLSQLGPQLDACATFDAGVLAPASDGAMDLRVELNVAPDGKVTSAKITSRKGGSDEEARCVRTVVEATHFDPPPNGKQVVVNVPLHLPTGSGPH